jgi:hypothetical protein
VWLVRLTNVVGHRCNFDARIKHETFPKLKDSLVLRNSDTSTPVILPHVFRGFHHPPTVNSRIIIIIIIIIIY